MTYTMSQETWKFEWPQPPKLPLTWIQILWIFLNPLIFFSYSMFDPMLNGPMKFVINVLGAVLWWNLSDLSRDVIKDYTSKDKVTTGKKEEVEVWSNTFFLDLSVMTFGCIFGLGLYSILNSPGFLYGAVMPLFFLTERAITRYYYFNNPTL
jgi:hypothetical protein